MAADRAEVSFDHQSLSWLADRHQHNDELRARCPVVWNQKHGGFWFVSGYDEVVAVARDSETFTPRYEVESTDGLGYIGIMGIPRREGMPPIGIAEAEGRRHAALRRVINPYMLPPAVAADRPFLEQAASWFLDQQIESGAMEMIHDFTGPVPALWTMRLLGLPATMWEHYAAYFHATAAFGPDRDEYKSAVSRTPEMIAELIEVIEARRKAPGADLMSQLVTVEVDGEPLANDELIAVLWNLIGGGLDTTTSLTALALVHMEQHPALRQRLIDEPDLVPTACEEYLRWTSVNETLTRTCTRDTELAGQELHRGDFVMISWLGANFDPAVFDRPYDVDLDRGTNAHIAFGLGAHRCIGLHVARSLFEIMVSEVLSRIPDYRVDRRRTRFYQGNPELYGVVSMPVEFTPGQPVGTARPF
ncbi:MAG: cytochrome P450 [Actinomycetota bacterium]|nr:cytochrome P450 [Actinomycetota bacterium]